MISTVLIIKFISIPTYPYVYVTVIDIPSYKILSQPSQYRMNGINYIRQYNAVDSGEMKHTDQELYPRTQTRYFSLYNAIYNRSVI